MRKFHSVLAAATLLGGGLVAGATGTATAVPYPGSVDTKCVAKALNDPQEGGAPARVRFRVKVPGDGAPEGKVTFTYVRRSNGNVVREFDRNYTGPRNNEYAFENIPQGGYRVDVHFNSKPADSVYQNCNTAFRQRIR